jgi:hypothetical protein
MPVKTSKVKGGWRNVCSGHVSAKKTTKSKAQAQARLIRAVSHGWKPTGKKRRRK